MTPLFYAVYLAALFIFAGALIWALHRAGK